MEESVTSGSGSSGVSVPLLSPVLMEIEERYIDLEVSLGVRVIVTFPFVAFPVNVTITGVVPLVFAKG